MSDRKNVGDHHSPHLKPGYSFSQGAAAGGAASNSVMSASLFPFPGSPAPPGDTIGSSKRKLSSASTDIPNPGVGAKKSSASSKVPPSTSGSQRAQSKKLKRSDDTNTDHQTAGAAGGGAVKRASSPGAKKPATNKGSRKASQALYEAELEKLSPEEKAIKISEKENSAFEYLDKRTKRALLTNDGNEASNSRYWLLKEPRNDSNVNKEYDEYELRRSIMLLIRICIGQQKKPLAEYGLSMKMVEDYMRTPFGPSSFYKSCKKLFEEAWSQAINNRKANKYYHGQLVNRVKDAMPIVERKIRELEGSELAERKLETERSLGGGGGVIAESSSPRTAQPKIEKRVESTVHAPASSTKTLAGSSLKASASGSSSTFPGQVNFQLAVPKRAVGEEIRGLSPASAKPSMKLVSVRPKTGSPASVAPTTTTTTAAAAAAAGKATASSTPKVVNAPKAPRKPAQEPQSESNAGHKNPPPDEQTKKASEQDCASITSLMASVNRPHNNYSRKGCWVLKEPKNNSNENREEEEYLKRKEYVLAVRFSISELKEPLRNYSLSIAEFERYMKTSFESAMFYSNGIRALQNAQHQALMVDTKTKKRNTQLLNKIRKAMDFARPRMEALTEADIAKRNLGTNPQVQEKIMKIFGSG